MVFLQSVVTIVYYLLVAFIAFVIIRNLLRSREWEREILYVIVLIPFLLRLLRLK